MTRKALVIRDNCVNTMQRALLLRKRSFYDAGFFKLMVANFVASIGNRGAQHELPVSTKVSK